MSLKSFDKMCENMILGKTVTEKDVFDERQNQVRTKLTIETLTVYIVSVLINNFIMDAVYQWCEGYAAPMILLGVICYLYWIIRNAIKDSFFGVKGSRSAKYVAFFIFLYSILFGIQYIFPILDNEKDYLFSDGKVTNNFIVAVTWLIFFACGVIVIILAKRYDKKMKREEELEKP